MENRISVRFRHKYASRESDSHSSSSYDNRRDDKNRTNWRNKQDGEKHDGNSRSANNYHSKDGPHIGFRFIESLLEQPLENVLSKISNNEDFFEFLKKELSSDFIVLIIKLLDRVCECDFSSIRLNILQKSLSKPFLNTVHVYISSLAIQNRDDKRRNSRFWDDPNCFWNNFSKICRTVLREMPHSYSDILSKILKVTSISLPQIEDANDIGFSNAIKDEFKSLIQMADTVIEEYEEKERKKTLAKKMNNEGEPPDDFRLIDIYPNTSELVSDQKPFLRKNVVDGPFKNVEHYLDVQFRLLREDFVGPLREGIKAYLSDSKSRIENIRIHRNVQFIQPITATEHYCVLLQIHEKRKSFIENSRRFMYGSLACFTNDNFKSIIFGRIVDSREEHLKNGALVIGFDNDEDILFNVDYIMVECNIYFEPYYHVLKVMQKVREDEFPMKNYIVDVDITVTMPSYITEETVYRIPTDDPEEIENCDQTFHQIPTENPFSLIDEILSNSPGEMRNWKPYDKVYKNFFNFNPSQNEAFIAALTRKFSVIQGPPGTGKTYVGLKIAETLLRNSGAWYHGTPMLVICYTNHALDQFLEGLTKTTRQIVRIGGQSKNENLAEFNLKNYFHKMGPAVYRSKKIVTTCSIEIKNIIKVLDMIRMNECIINFRALRKVIPNFQTSWLQNTSNDAMLKWLLGVDSEYTIGMSAQNNEDEADDSDEENFTDEIGVNINEKDEDLLGIDEISRNFELLLCLDELHEKIEANRKYLMRLQQNLDKRKNQNKGNYDLIFQYTSIDAETNHLERIHYIAKENLNAVRKTVPEEEASALNTQYMRRSKRWDLYFHWVELYREYLMQRLEKLNTEFREYYRIYSQAKDIEDINILKSMKVIGMTTTAAARLHSSLKMIKSPIVIVEEAAEVLEAHIVSALTKDCQQLILIGDHQQLKPSTSNYQIERFYHLGISLFERMILNKIEYFSLNIQHRMRPEISALIAPSIYPNLKNHESIFDRPRIVGVEKCVYFIDHEFPEDAENDGSSTTKRNKHEVEFLIQLAKYLILNGYKSSEITILAAYLGQMYEFHKERAYHSILQDVNITVLDNYQGEESDIILLSLVRNNAEEKVGFLSIDNRVCVALSRARNGLYVMGNMAHLCKKSELWKEIKETLVKQEAFGKSLTLICENHKKLTMVSKGDDFFAVAEGGCDQKCGMLLACGHICQRLCHTEDADHSKYKCREKCEKQLCTSNPEHLCKKECYEECGPCTYPFTAVLNCEHEALVPCYLDIEEYDCKVEVQVKLPCGHETTKYCFIDAEKHRCPFKCDTRLECGHSCLKNCHFNDDPDHLQYKCPKPCERPRRGCRNEGLDGHICQQPCHAECSECGVIVRKARTKCPHLFDAPCHVDVDADDIKCHKPCTKELSCGHKCKSGCGQECQPCAIKVEKLIDGCNHKLKVLCSEEPKKDLCSGKCPRVLECGHVCKKRCREVCDPKSCMELVDTCLPAKCGHNVIKRLPCSVSALYKNTEGKPKDAIALESYCTEPCNEILDCSHNCTGTCSECFQGRIHKRCGQKCGKILICNHECEITCTETCKPCQKPCLYKCKHSKCKQRCGEPCKNCRENCERKCEHQKCEKRCGEICSVPPCEMSCDKKLECGHQCVGFCGDPCPPLCRVCNKDELEEVFFGTETDENSRFVLLEDCGHVIESSGMEMWLEQDANEIKYKVCPKCKTNISTTERYSDYIKRAVDDIKNVKAKQYGNAQEIHIKRIKLIQKILGLKKEIDNNLNRLPIDKKSDYRRFGLSFLETLYVLRARLNKETDKRRIQHTNLMELNFIEVKLSIMEEIIKIVDEKSDLYQLTKDIEDQIKFITNNLLKKVDDITITEIRDIKKEMNRLNRMIQLQLIRDAAKTNNQVSEEFSLNIKKISDKLISLTEYNEELDSEIKSLLTELGDQFKTTLGITNTERKEIVLAMGLSQGHWYKCPNGHPYVITECGGAMQISTCNECGAQIGGSNHALLSTNALASEMDGARHSAWSTGANMANYDIQDQI